MDKVALPESDLNALLEQVGHMPDDQLARVAQEIIGARSVKTPIEAVIGDEAKRVATHEARAFLNDEREHQRKRFWWMSGLNAGFCLALVLAILTGTNWWVRYRVFQESDKLMATEVIATQTRELGDQMLRTLETIAGIQIDVQREKLKAESALKTAQTVADRAKGIVGELLEAPAFTPANLESLNQVLAQLGENGSQWPDFEKQIIRVVEERLRGDISCRSIRVRGSDSSRAALRIETDGATGGVIRIYDKLGQERTLSISPEGVPTFSSPLACWSLSVGKQLRRPAVEIKEDRHGGRVDVYDTGDIRAAGFFIKGGAIGAVRSQHDEGKGVRRSSP